MSSLPPGTGSGAGPRRYRVVVCRGPECGERRGSAVLAQAFQEAARAQGLGERLELGWQACFGRCRQGPNVLVRLAPAGPPRTLLATLPTGPNQSAALYGHVTRDDVGRIVESHLGRGIIVRDLVFRPDAPERQQRVAEPASTTPSPNPQPPSDPASGTPTGEPK